MKPKMETPILSQLLLAGAIYVKNDEYHGKAGDGVEVSFGMVGQEVETELYLQHCPTPDTW